MTDGFDAARMHPHAAPRRGRPSGALLMAVAAYVVLTALVVAAAAGVDLGALRAPLGLLLGLAAPGWLLLRATVGRRLGAGQAAALSVPLSLAICALSGTALTLAGVKLTALPLALVVCGVSLACLVVALVRGTLPSPRAFRRAPGPGAQLTPRMVVAAGLALAILAMAASTIQQIVRVDDAARASTPFVALTGKLERSTPTAGGRRASVAFTTINSQPRAIRPTLEISVLPGGNPPLERPLAIAANRQATVREALDTRCGDEVIATLSGDGVPARTSTLRISCPR